MAVLRSIQLAALLIPAVALTQGCLPGMVKATAENEKDTSGTYDGQWVATYLKNATTQQGLGNTILTCGGQEGQKFGPVDIKDGAISVNFTDLKGSSFVNPAGQFFLSMPMQSEATVSGTTATNAKQTMLLSGTLSENKGTMTIGIAELSNTGCTYKLQFDRV